MDPYKYEWHTDNAHNPHNNIYVIDAKIEELATLLNAIKNYENPYEYISFLDSKTRKSIQLEITTDMLVSTNPIIQQEMALSPSKSNFQQAIFSKYSELDHTKKYRLTNDIPISMKIKLLYAERLAYDRKYYLTIFPPTYASKFKESGFKNFYSTVKQDLTTEIDDLVTKKIKLLSNQ